MTFWQPSPSILLKFPILISPMIALLRLLTQCENSDYDDVDEYGDNDNDDMTQ